jgi:MoaA/NifB/PqqE/SkfB family radical SAM enzyme
MEVGSHTHAHLLLPAHSREVSAPDIDAAKARLEALLGRAVSAFCYPYGAHDPESVASASDAGHSYAVTTEPHAVTPAVDPMLVPRLEVDNVDGASLATTINAILASDSVRIAPRAYAGPPIAADQARRANETVSEEEFARRELRLTARPTFLIVDPSSRCNARCVMCPVSFRGPEDHGTDLPRPVFEAVSALIPTARHINLFSSGEPTIARDIEAIISAARRDSSSESVIWISTNGKRLPERVLDLLIAPRIGVQFSVDGGTKDVFEAIRRGITFEELHDTLARVRARKSTRPYPVLGFSTTLSKRNMHDLANIFALARTYGVGHVHFYEEDPEVPAEEPFALTEEDRPLLDAQMPSILASGVAFSSEMSFRGARGLRASEPAPPANPPHLECRAPWKVFHQRADGRVLPCCTLRRSMGDATKQTVEEIWNGPEYVALRRAFAEQRNIPGTCYRCADPLRTCQ